MIEVVAVIATSLGGAMALVITTVCFNLRRLRCATIECCGSKCTRETMSAEELAADQI